MLLLAVLAACTPLRGFDDPGGNGVLLGLAGESRDDTGEVIWWDTGDAPPTQDQPEPGAEDGPDDDPAPLGDTGGAGGDSGLGGSGTAGGTTGGSGGSGGSGY